MGQYDPIFEAAGKEWNVDPNLLRAMAAQESSGNPRAVSRAGAVGLMQIIPATQKYLGITDPTDPVQSIYGGAKYMSEALDKEKTPEDALRYYHGGPDWRDSYGPESRAYAPAVTAKYQRISGAAPVAAAPKKQSYDDFLAKTGATGAAPAAESHADFLARTGATAAAPETAEPAPDAGLNEYGITGDPQQFNQAQPGATIGSAGSGSRILDAVKSGWDNTPNPLMAPKLQQQIEAGGPIGRYITSPLLQLGGNALAAGAAGFKGVQQALVEVGGGDAGPGRDIASYLEVAPFMPREVPRVAMPAAPNPLAAVDRPYLTAPAADAIESSMQRRGNALAGPEAGAPAPSPGMGGPVPQSVGAAASRDMTNPSLIDMSPKEVQAYRSTAEGQKLLEPQTVGMADRNLYVRGSSPNTAEIEQTVNTARELKSLGVTAPEVSQEAKQIAQDNDAARSIHLADTVKSQVDIMRREAQQKADIEAQKPEVFGKASPLTDQNAQNIVKYIKDTLNSPENRQNTPLQSDFAPLLKRVINDDGTAKITDPQELWGLRQDIQRLTSKRMEADNPNLHYIAHDLNGLAGVIDKQIESVAPGYRDMMDTYAAHARAIDEMKVLQGHEKGLYVGGGGQIRISFDKMQRFMKNVVDMRSTPATDMNAYKAISDATMQRLWALRDDLRRSASAQELARAPGSDTGQNLFDAAKGAIAGHAGTVAAAGVGHVIGGVPGAIATATVKNGISNFLSARSERARTARGMQLLRPDPSQLHNPLAGP